MIIKKITIQGFKSIYDRTEFSFDENGLWKISGPVGSGKTTVGEAILWCLYGSVKDRTGGELISWGLKKCEGIVEMATGGHDLVIRRLMKRQGQGEMDILVDGEPLEYTDKRSGQQILESEYYDVSRTAVESLCIISFNNFRSIAQMNPGSKESRQFIDDVFGFGIVKSYIDEAKVHVSSLRDEMTGIDAVVRSLEREKFRLEEGIDRYRSMMDVPSDEEISIRKDIASLQEVMARADGDSQRRISGIKSEIAGLDTRMSACTAEGKVISKNISLIEGGKCPVCGNHIDPGVIEEYKERLSAMRGKYKELKGERDEMAKDLDAYMKECSAMKRDIGTKITSLQSRLQEISMHKSVEIDGYETRIRDIESRISSEKARKTSIEMDMSGWKELYDILYGSSRSVLMKHYVGELNNNINYYMQELQQPYVITFDDRFACTITAFGEDGISPRSLSTGQEKIVNTAVIFGILKTLLNGISFNIIFLDELTSNMHDDLRDITCEMLQKNIKDKCIFIISHAPIDETPFTGEIKVKIAPREEDGRLIQNSIYRMERYEKDEM